MFTGIITDIGTVRSAEERGDRRLMIGCGYDLSTVDLGASIACSGACLTVVDKGTDWFAVDVSHETQSRTVPGQWAEGAQLNLERSLRVGDELGGHIVTGHVDAVGEVVEARPEGDSVRILVRDHDDIASRTEACRCIDADDASRRREERAQDVPIPIATVSGDSLDRIGRCLDLLELEEQSIPFDAQTRYYRQAGR